MPIAILEPFIAAQIAAGEVIERPASVVKELMENSLDAGAHRITLEVSGGGVREIKIQDDGCGIPAAEVELAFERHATSKLRQVADLWAIKTLGFRGEALPSIATVAQVICVTRPATEEVGTEVRFAGGELQASLPRSCPVGTSISVRNLFYNIPVRREYLRAEATEASAISAIAQQYALAYANVSFRLLLEGRLAFQTTGNGNMRDVLLDLYGLDTARQMLPVEVDSGAGEEALKITGFISPPSVTRGNREYLQFFVNQRAIQPRGPLLAVLLEAYHTSLMKGRFPVAVLALQVHPSAVDVNVHPTKSEVRFRHHQRVMAVVGRGIREALTTAGIQTWVEEPRIHVLQPSELRAGSQGQSGAITAPSWGVAERVWRIAQSKWDVGGSKAPQAINESPAPPFPAAVKARKEGEEAEEDLFPEAPEATEAPEVGKGADSSPPPAFKPPQELPPPSVPPKAALPPLRVVGQVGLTYIVAESPEGMYLIDQHASHERITYEKLLAQNDQGTLEAQELLLPQTFTLPPATVEVLLGQSEALRAWGFSLEAWGEGLLRVRAIPAILALEYIEEALLELAAKLTGAETTTPLDWREALLLTLACHTAVRAGQVLALEEMRALLHQLEQCSSPRTCPHGRPTMVLLTPGQLERQFGRRG